MTIFYDVLAMGVALAVAIGLFATLFVVPFVVVWFAVRGVGGAWRWSTGHVRGALRAPAPVSRQRHAFGALVRSRRT